MHRTDDKTITGHGTWWTAWCRAAGLTTHDKGSEAFLTQDSGTSITYSGNLDISLPEVGDFISGQLGFSVTNSKSTGEGYGCVNSDGKAYSVWFQEKMRWAETQVYTTITYSGANW